MKIEIEISEEVEGTAYPYWLILDPRQMFKPDHHILSSMVTGPFFSREEATLYLNHKRHHFSKRATVYRASAHGSFRYRDAIDAAQKAAKR